MKRIARIALFTIIFIASQTPFAAAQENAKPVAPFQIFDKYIIITHAHTDHTGGGNALKALTGARVGMAEGDWQMNGLGNYMSSGGQKREFKPIPRDDRRQSLLSHKSFTAS